MKHEGDMKKITFAILIACAVVFLVLFAIFNKDVVGSVLSSVWSVFSPVVFGFGIAYILNPILRFYEFKVFKKIKRINVVRALSIVCTFLTATVMVAGFVYLLLPSVITTVKEFMGKYNDYLVAITDLVNRLIVRITGKAEYANLIDTEHVKEFILEFFTKNSGEVDINTTIKDYVSTYGMGVLTALKNILFAIIISVYVLISKEKLQAQIRKLAASVMSEKTTKKVGKYVLLTHKTFTNYFMGSIFDCFVVMILTFVAMLIAGIPYPLLIAVIIGVTNIIPILGPFIGAVPSFFIIFIVDPIKAIIFAVLILLIQQIDGNIIAPKIHGESTGISSLAVIIVILVMGEYFGIMGMLIGVPLFAVIVSIVTEYIDNRLRLKGMSTDTGEYYLKDAVAEPHTNRKPVATRVVLWLWENIKKVGKMFVKKDAHEDPAAEDKQQDEEKEQNNNGEQ